MLLVKTWSLLNVLFLKHLQNRDYIYRSTNASPEGKAYNWVGQNCITVLSDYRACLKISSQNKRQAVACGVDVNKCDTYCSMATPFDCLRRELSLVGKKFKNNCSVVNSAYFTSYSWNNTSNLLLKTQPWPPGHWCGFVWSEESSSEAPGILSPFHSAELATWNAMRIIPNRMKSV